MLKQVKYIDYDANYTYSPPEKDAVINLDDISRIVAIARENTRRPFDDLVRIFFRDGRHIDVIGKPADFVTVGNEQQSSSVAETT